MKEFIKFSSIHIFTFFLTLFISGCSLHSKYGEEVDSKVEEISTSQPIPAAISTAPQNSFLASLPPDPYFLQVYPPLSPEYTKLYLDAMQALTLNDTDKAILIFNQLIMLDPSKSSAYCQLALIHKNKQDNEQASAYAKLAIEKNSYNYEAHNLLGIIAREAGDFTTAEQHYLKINSLWNGYADAHLNLGILYDLYLGKFDLAIEQYETYLLIVVQDKKVSAWINDLKRRIGNAN